MISINAFECLQDDCNLKDNEYGTINELEAVLTATGYLSKLKSSTVFVIALIILTAVGTIFGSFLVTFKDSDTDKGYTTLGFGNILTSTFLSYFNSLFHLNLFC